MTASWPPSPSIPCRHRVAGSTTVVALLMLSTLATLAATMLFSISTRYNAMANTGSWQQAIHAAESGANVAIANLHWSIRAGPGVPVAFQEARGWSGPDADGTYTLRNLPVQSPAVGGTRMWANATVEAPAALKDAAGLQWYRVRATGYTALGGLRRTGNDANPDPAARGRNTLRKLDYLTDHFVAAHGEFGVGPSLQSVATPQATRRIEIILQPQTRWTAGVVASERYDFPYIDSFDSTDPAKSNASGTYSFATAQSNGDVVVNSTIPPKGTIMGNASINAGGDDTVANGWGANDTAQKVSGQASNNVYVPTPPVASPAWAGSAIDLGASPSTIKPGTSTSYYKVSSLSGATISLPTGKTSATVHVLVNGDISSGLTIEKGVTAKIYFTGDFSMKASQLDNQNKLAAGLQLYGIEPAAGQTRTVKFQSGSPGFVYVTFYAPSANFTTNGNPDFCGAFVGKSFEANGNCTLHYDEALARIGDPIGFTRMSWVEDSR